MGQERVGAKREIELSTRYTDERRTLAGDHQDGLTTKRNLYGGRDPQLRFTHA